MGETGIVYDPICLLHDTGEHIEIAQRLEVIDKALEEFGLKEKLQFFKPPLATEKDLEIFHAPHYIQKVKEIAQAGGANWDNETIISPRSFEAALASAGGAIHAIDLVMEKKVKNAFVLNRPPGHHAEADRAYGFCLFNNGVIAVKQAQEKYGLKKILILDWDAHHGNGIQRAFYEDPSVLYISIHQDGIFPQTGWANEKGAGPGEGFNVNIPVSRWTGDGGYYYLFTKILLPIAYKYEPELIVINAGFDAHFNDPMSGLEVTTAGFKKMTQMIKEVADKVCEGKMVALLEGGYDLETLGYSVAAMISVMAEVEVNITDPIPTPPNIIKPQTRLRLDDTFSIQKKQWNLEG